MVHEKHFDALIVVTPSDCARLMPLYPRLVSKFDYGKLCFIGSEGVGELARNSAIADRVSWVDENDLIPFDDVHACISKKLEPLLHGQPLARGVTGWYYQQFLKMQYANVCNDEYYMVWDGDTIPCRKIKMFSEETGLPYLDLKHEYHTEYFETMGKILPGFGKVVERSFISEHMLIKSEIMKALISDIENNDAIEGVKFWEKIINCIEPQKIYDSSFSEFETYGTYVTIRFPEAYEYREWHSFRLGGSFFDMNTICDRDFKWLAVDFDAISFEKDQTPAEGVGGYFDNPDIQKKISAKKLLQEIQPAFADAYKEVWDDDPSVRDANIRAGSYQKERTKDANRLSQNWNELSFSGDFFLDEVRNGFYVSETMKRYWAAQLVVLSEIKKICDRHDLNWYADSGTLIGAVRHKGYIPWDDDLDISLLRADYEKLLSFARHELPEGYCVLTSSDEAEYDKPFARITNSHAIDTHSEHLEMYYGCPFVVGVDIFPLDNIYDDPKKEEDRTRRGSIVYSVIKQMWEKSLTDNEITEKVKNIEKELGVSIGTDDIYRKLLCIFEEIATECKDSESKDIALMYVWVNERKCRYRRANYCTCQIVPFETSTMIIPVGYHEVLTSYYGDYMSIVKGSGVHKYPAYKEQEEIYRQKFGVNPNRYNFKRDCFNPSRSRNDLKTQQKEIFEIMHSIHEKIGQILSIGDETTAIQLLQSCQATAVSIGTTIDNKFGEGTKAVSFLENYCEKIYEASENWNHNSVRELEDALVDAENVTMRLFQTAKKEILFLVCKATWWSSVDSIFNMIEGNPDYEIKIIPVSYLVTDGSGTDKRVITENEFFKNSSKLSDRITDFENYNPSIRHPDTIIIQYPYDGYSAAMSVSPALYSDELRKYTDELVFVPFLSPDPPVSDEDIAFKAIKEMIEQPAYFYADRVLVETEELRKCYIKLLVDMTGEGMCDYWEKSIVVKDAWRP